MTVRYSAQSDGGEGLTNQITKTVPILILWWNLLIIYRYFQVKIPLSEVYIIILGSVTC